MSDSRARGGPDVQQIEALLRRIESAENTGDAPALVGILADDAVIMAPNVPTQEGRQACADFVTEILADQTAHFVRRIRYESAEIKILGDHAFDRGRFAFTVTPRVGGDTSHATGQYLFSVLAHGRAAVGALASDRQSRCAGRDGLMLGWPKGMLSSAHRAYAPA